MSKELEISAMDLKPIIEAAKQNLLPVTPQRRLFLPSGRVMDDWNIGVTGMKHLVQFCRKHGDRINTENNPFYPDQIQDREWLDLQFVAEMLYMTGEYDEICANLRYRPVHKYAQGSEVVPG